MIFVVLLALIVICDDYFQFQFSKWLKVIYNFKLLSLNFFLISGLFSSIPWTIAEAAVDPGKLTNSKFNRFRLCFGEKWTLQSSLIIWMLFHESSSSRVFTVSSFIKQVSHFEFINSQREASSKIWILNKIQSQVLTNSLMNTLTISIPLQF